MRVEGQLIPFLGLLADREQPDPRARQAEPDGREGGPGQGELREQLEEARAALSEARSELRSMYEAAQRAERATSRSGLSAPSGARGELVHVPRSTQVVLWRPRNERGKE